MGHETADEVVWHKGKPCDSGACVEVAFSGENVLVRSTVLPDSPIRLTRGEWSAFLASAKEGHFDHL